MNSTKKRIPIIALLAVLLVVGGTLIASVFAAGTSEATETGSFEKTALVEDLMQSATRFIVVKHKQLGGSHYAYTDALAETNGDPAPHSEYNFEPGAQLVLLTLEDRGDGNVSTYEEVLLGTSRGVIRDPDVSADGSKVLFSMKKSTTDDYHLYEMDLSSREVTQLTFGGGQSDIEPRYLAGGNIVFCSNRCVQTVDCWYTPVCNLYILERESGEIIRVSYDQVHDTYPTVTSDGRVLYTRWDYNDRNQMFIQSIFQMFRDGTGQTEVYGNDSDFPTTLLHTREIPGENGCYISIAAGHHMAQYGKLVIVDTTDGRNVNSAVTYVFPDKYSNKKNSKDTEDYSEGTVYKYPYAISRSEFLVSTAAKYSGNKTAFDICLMNTEGESVTICKGSGNYPASQIVPVKSRTLFDRAGFVDYSADTASYYLANVYEGEGMKGVEKGSAKTLRVVSLGYREAAIGATNGAGTGTSDPYSPIATGNGAWDVKCVLGVVPIEEDGSVFFSVPARTPLYFQILDENGDVIQSMRSWSTLQPNETFSCVGCHVEKNNAPTAGNAVTMALKKGVQKLEKDSWMQDNDEYADYDPYRDQPIGFSYLRQVQSIFDESCVECHSDTAAALKRVSAEKMIGIEDEIYATNLLIRNADTWEWLPDHSLLHAPFGSKGTANDLNSVCDGTVSLCKTVTVTQYDAEACRFYLNARFIGKLTLTVNGSVAATLQSTALQSNTVELPSDLFRIGENTVRVDVEGETTYFDASLYCGKAPTVRTEYVTLGDEWSYRMGKESDQPKDGWNSFGFNDSDWEKGIAPFGDRNNDKTKWNASKLLWLRKSFTVDDVSVLSDAEFGINAWYDDNIHIYLNGKEIFADSGWIDGYSILTVRISAEDFRKGENVLAVSLGSSGSFGGSELDLTFYADITVSDGVEKTSTAPLSLESFPLTGTRMKKQFPLSYLSLTGSSVRGGNEWVGNPTGRLTNWISSMSQCEILEPYSFGAFKSGIIEKLRSGHGSLSREKIAAIACWIDLGVPCYADYREGCNWDGNLVREYEEKSNKRAYYDTLDDLAAGKLGDTLQKESLTVAFISKDGKKKAEQTGIGYAILYVDAEYQDGDTIKLTLPEGKRYVGVTLNGRMGESILYLPKGEWSYTFAGLEAAFPGTMNPKKAQGYDTNTVLVRLLSEEEIAKCRNLALNPYDQTDAKDAYPHVTADSYYGKQAEFAPRNAIDGFSANDAHGTYPYQSWGTEMSDRHWIQVDFGRKVSLDYLELVIRADFATGHDTHFTSVKVQLDDGTTLTVPLYRTSDAIRIDLGSVKTSTVKLLGFVRAENTWAAVTELRAFGCEA